MASHAGLCSFVMGVDITGPETLGSSLELVGRRNPAVDTGFEVWAEPRTSQQCNWVPLGKNVS